jgi:hypothetical protein
MSRFERVAAQNVAAHCKTELPLLCLCLLPCDACAGWLLHRFHALDECGRYAVWSLPRLYMHPRSNPHRACNHKPTYGTLYLVMRREFISASLRAASSGCVHCV